MANAILYKWRWLGYSQNGLPPTIVNQSSVFFVCKNKCLQTAYKHSPLLNECESWYRIDLYLIKDNGHTGEAFEKHIMTSYPDIEYLRNYKKQ
jgi:hypothetical protein